MKYKNWLPLLLTVGILIAFFGYKQIAAFRADRTAPEIRIDETQMMSISVATPRAELLQGVTAKDSRDGDITDSVVIENVCLVDKHGLLEVTYAVADKAGNVSKAKRQIQYTDYVQPRFALKRALIYSENMVFDILNDVDATDIMDGNIQHRIRAALLSEGAISDVGIHQVVFQVTNDLGDTTQLQIPVEVIQGSGYGSSLLLKEYIVYLPVGASFRPEDYLDQFTAKGQTYLLNQGIPEDYSLKISGAVEMDREGTYIVEYLMTPAVQQVNNEANDRLYSGYTKLVVVVEG